MSERREQDALERDSASLRQHYAKLPKSEPGAEVDAQILATARDRNARRPRRMSPVWLAAFGVAACVSVAVVLVPALLVEAPESHPVPQTSELVIKPTDTLPVQTVAHEETPAPARPEVPALEREHADRALAEQAQRARQAMRRDLQPAPPVAAAPVEEFADTEAQPLREARAELAKSGESEWRTRILALEADGEHWLAEALLADFRAQFGRPGSFSLQDLAREAAANAREKDNN